METWYLDVVSGRRDDLLSRAIWCLLWLLSLGYWLIVSVRNGCYQIGLLSSTPSTIPILSVGNLSTGGTGKTPTVAYFAQAFLDQNHKTAVVARGYGARAGELNDEGQLLELLLPGLVQFQDPNRRGSVKAAESQGIDVIILDDGFQHRKLARDFELLLIDATNPKAYGYLLPAGLLRDPLGQLWRADAVLITRANQTSRSEIEAIQGFVKTYTSAPVFRSEFAIQSLVNLKDSSESSPEVLKNKRIAGICGIGNPQAFRDSLENLGAQISFFHAFPDHYHFEQQDWEQLLRRLADNDVSTLVMTDKDAVKLRRFVKSENQVGKNQVSKNRVEGGAIEFLSLRIALKLESGSDLMSCVTAKLWPGFENQGSLVSGNQ